MGCCKSDLRASRPIRTNMSRKSHEPYEEETKNPDFYRKSSEVVELDQSHAESHKGPVYPPNVTEQKKDLEASLPRRETSFNLNKDLMESIRRERSIRKESVPQDMDMSVYKITREQHEMILMLVNEVSNAIETDLARLNDYLTYYYYEYEELHVSVEQLKNNNKDIENCIDDLKAYPVLNEQAFYYHLGRRSRLVKNIVREYHLLKQGTYNYTYEKFRETVLNLIRRYNSNIPDDDFNEAYAKDQKEVKFDDRRTKETAATIQAGNTATERTEAPTYVVHPGNWSQSEGSGDPVWDTDRGYDRKNSMEKVPLEVKIDVENTIFKKEQSESVSSTIFKKDASEREEFHRRSDMAPLNVTPNGVLIRTQHYKVHETKESLLDVFPRRVKSNRKGSREMEHLRKDSGSDDRRVTGQSELDSIDVYLKENSVRGNETRVGEAPKKAKVSGHLAMVMKLKKLNQQRQETVV